MTIESRRYVIWRSDDESLVVSGEVLAGSDDLYFGIVVDGTSHGFSISKKQAADLFMELRDIAVWGVDGPPR